MRLIVGILVALVLAAIAMTLATGPHAAQAFQWAVTRQQEVQNAMASTLRAVKAGDAVAVWTLFGLSASYGFLHALGPGHGKVLLGGAAMGSTAPAWRMLGIGAAASLMQAVAAILLVAVGVKLFAMGSADASTLAEGWLADLSRWAIAAIGAVLVWRGLKGLRRKPHHHHAHCGCGHSHGPAPEEVTALTSPREVLALILSVAVRPCTGALFLLVIAWRFGIPVIGALAVLAMGLGTALFNSIAIGGGMLARGLVRFGEGRGSSAAAAGLQLAAGAVIIALTLTAMP